MKSIYNKVNVKQGSCKTNMSTQVKRDSSFFPSSTFLITYQFHSININNSFRLIKGQYIIEVQSKSMCKIVCKTDLCIDLTTAMHCMLDRCLVTHTNNIYLFL
jgi:hypothetical protein